MQYINYVITTMQDVTENGIPDEATRENILTNLHLIFFDGKRWKKGELKTTQKLLDLVLATEVGPKNKTLWERATKMICGVSFNSRK